MNNIHGKLKCVDMAHPYSIAVKRVGCLWPVTCSIIISVTSQWVRWRLKPPATPLLAQLFVQAQKKIKNKSNLRVISLCERNPNVIGGFPSQRTSNAESVPIWCPRHDNVTECKFDRLWLPWFQTDVTGLCFWCLYVECTKFYERFNGRQYCSLNLCSLIGWINDDEKGERINCHDWLHMKALTRILCSVELYSGKQQRNNWSYALLHCWPLRW